MGQHGIFHALNGNIYGNMSNNTQDTLVMLHGFGSNQGIWHYIIPYLAYYFKVVVFDLAFSPNAKLGLYNPCKYSSYDAYANDLVDVLEELNITKAIYVGHSMSAMIGCIASLKKPQLFQQLILLNGSPRYLNDVGYYGGFKRQDVDRIFKQISQNYTRWVETFAPQGIGVSDSKSISEFEQSLMRIDPKTTLSVAQTVFLSDYRSILGKVRVPTTIIQSEIDYVVPLFVTKFMDEQLGDVANNVIVLKTQGHFPMLTAYHLLLMVLNNVLGVNG